MLKDLSGKLRLRLLYSCDCLDEAIAAQCEDPVRIPLQDLDQVEWIEEGGRGGRGATRSRFALKSCVRV